MVCLFFSKEVTIIDSILNSVKKNLGITEEYTHFDPDIIMHINTVFSILAQLGVGSEDGFSIADETAVWSDYLPDSPKLNFVKSYVYLKVRLLFDPPTNSSVTEATNRMIDELEWRINAAVDYNTEPSEGEEVEIQNE